MTPVQPLGMPIYKQVLLNVRPPRLAIAFPSGSGWETPAQRLLEGFSRIWGGAGDVIFPVREDGEVHPALWRVAVLTMTRMGLAPNIIGTATAQTGHDDRRGSSPSN